MTVTSYIFISVQARLALERSIESEGHFEKAVIELAKLYISEKNIAKAVETCVGMMCNYILSSGDPILSSGDPILSSGDPNLTIL